MRAYIPVGWEQLAAFDAAGRLEGPLRGCAVDPSWRAGDPEVDEEEWEFEAQLAAAEALADLDGGVVLAVDVPDPEPGGSDSPFEDGWVSLDGSDQPPRHGGRADHGPRVVRRPGDPGAAGPLSAQPVRTAWPAPRWRPSACP